MKCTICHVVAVCQEIIKIGCFCFHAVRQSGMKLEGKKKDHIC